MSATIGTSVSLLIWSATPRETSPLARHGSLGTLDFKLFEHHSILPAAQIFNHGAGSEKTTGAVRVYAEIPRWLVEEKFRRDNTNLVQDLQSAIEARQKLESQQAENKAVQKEFNGLADDADIYRLVGPVLLKQDKSEAKSTVDGRLDFIGKEITRTEARIKDIQQNSERSRVDLMQVQQKIQMAQGQATG